MKIVAVRRKIMNVVVMVKTEIVAQGQMAKHAAVVSSFN